ncbi:TPA: hypothetical protein RUX88_004681, partial [Escherichia coli]|nr:hypothetical protein [Escherichia coli]
RSAKPRKRKPAPQRSKLPRYVVKLHDDDFFDEEDAEVLRFDNFDDAVECCADLNIPFFVDAGNKKLVFWFVRVGVRLENGIYGHSRFCNTDFDDKWACLNLSGV